jgi:hypothetical protein
MTANYDRFLEATRTASALLKVANLKEQSVRDRALDSVMRAHRLEALEGQLPVASVAETALDEEYGVIAGTLDRLDSILSQPDAEVLLPWTHELDFRLREGVQRIQAHLDSYLYTGGVLKQDPRPELRSILQELSVAERVDSYISGAERLNRQASEAAEIAKTAAEQAQTAAGFAGDATLSLYFAKYAKHQLASSNWFRAATIVTIVAAIAVAATVPHEKGEDLVAAIYRIAIVAGTAGLATYFGRQAAHYRRVGTWAKALQVQLQSFPAFMAAIPNDKTKDVIYEAFAKRVLGAPPEAASSSDTSAEVMTQPLIEALLRRTAS